MSTRSTLRLVLVAFALTSLPLWPEGALGASNEGAPQIVLKIASIEAPSSPLGVQLDVLRRHLEHATAGALRVKLLLAGALGDEASLAERTRAGSVQAFAGSTAALAAHVPELDVLAAPYLFAAEQAVDRALDGPVQRAIGASLARAGYRFAAWGPADALAWYARGRPLREPAEARGLRVPRGPRAAQGALVRALGMTEVTLEPGANLGDALRRGHIDAFDDTLLGAVAAGRLQGVTHVTLSQHALAPSVIVYSKRWFDGLPEKLQEQLARIPQAIVRDARQASRGMAEELIRHLRGRGIEVHEPVRAERQAFARAAQNVARNVAREAGPDAWRVLRAARR